MIYFLKKRRNKAINGVNSGKVDCNFALTKAKGFGMWAVTKTMTVWQILQMMGSLPLKSSCLSLHVFAVFTSDAFPNSLSVIVLL